MTEAADRLAAALADRYRLERELGQGGMATVYLAEDLKHHRKVAIKVLRPELAAALGSERFLAEIRTTANLQHPNIVPLFDSGEADGFVYYVMPYVAGESLRELLAREKRLDVPTAVAIARGVAQALATAHEAGVVHRDIKPENILLVRDQPVVADFGIARAVDAAGGERITATGMAIGTPAYMSPEQAMGEGTLDARSDLYSLGCVIYEMLAGSPPFSGGTVQALLAQRLVGPPPPLTTVPPAVDEVVRRSLATAPQDRFATALALADALVAAASRHGTAAARPRSGRPLWIGVAAVVVLAIVAALAWKRLRGAGSGASAPEAAASLAVLPIENIGGDSTKEYLADGMTTEMASTLRQLPGLEVAGDQSTFRFKNTSLPPDRIAHELHVGMLLTGRLQSQGGRIRLFMQLTNGTGTLLWSKQYDRESRDNFALQDEITKAVAGELRVVLQPHALAVAHAGRTENPQAHDLYLRGIFAANQLSEQGLTRGIAFFQRALALDPDYAQAAVAMSFANDMLGDVYRPSHQQHELALAAAQRALASDSLLAEAHMLYGFELVLARWDWRAGESEMRRGLALSPNAPEALFMYGMYLGFQGQTDSALTIADRLIKVDPLSAMSSLMRTMILAWARRWTEAVRQDSITKTLDSTVVYGDSWGGMVLRGLGRYDRSVAEYKRYETLTGGPAYGLAMTYAAMGRRDSALAVVHQLEAEARTRWVDPVEIAAAYAALDDHDQALAWLQKGYDSKDGMVALFVTPVSPWWDNMRGDPRFSAFVAKVRSTVWTS